MTGIALLHLHHLLGCAIGHDAPAALPALGTEVNNAVSHLYDIEVVLDHEYGIARIHELLEHLDEHAHVLEVQTRRGLVQDVEGLARLLAVKLLGELHALGLAARERRGTLAQVDVAQPHVKEGLQLVLDARDAAKERERLGHGHVEHIADALAVIGDLKGLAIIALAVADLAGHVDVGQEVHLYLYLAVTLAGFATPSRYVEREASRTVATSPALGHGGKEVAQVVPEADVGGGVGAWRATDGALVDVDDLVHDLSTLVVDQALELLIGTDDTLGVMHDVGQRRRQRIGDER